MNTTLHGLTNNLMELGFSEQFTSEERELEIGNKLGLTNNEMELGLVSNLQVKRGN